MAGMAEEPDMAGMGGMEGGEGGEKPDMAEMMKMLGGMKGGGKGGDDDGEGGGGGMDMEAMMQMLGGMGGGKGGGMGGKGGGRGGKGGGMGGKGGGEQDPDADAEKASSDGKYIWNQKGEEIQVRFIEHKGLTKKDIKVKFSRFNLTVEVKGETVVDGKLFSSVDVDECVWSIDPDTKECHVMLTKQDDSKAWSSLLAA